MKTHTSEYKEEIKKLGRQIDSKISFNVEGVTLDIPMEQINSVTPSFQSSILKSMMKELDIDSNILIPKGTEFNYKFGLKVGDEFEYIDYGNYIVYSVEKQEDYNSYKIVAYDKMLYSMVDYDSIFKENPLSYPLTIREFTNILAEKIGLQFKDSITEFTNYDKKIKQELYLNQGYTIRDVFDELSQVVSGTICLDSQDRLEIRYITNTEDTIDEEYLKDINVNFSEKYGPINAIVLSRSADTDTVYLRDEDSIERNGLCELKIKDNQIMNWNDRSDYLRGLLSRLDGLQYYLNDYTSTGITYYEACDRYNVKIGENTYSCVMFNDEVDITQGVQELVHTDMPEETETDYTKSDKTDQKINQTYLIVDKQGQEITALVSKTDGLEEKTSQLTIDVDQIKGEIGDIADITVSEQGTGTLVMNDINESEPIYINVYPTSSEDVSYLYPANDLYPENTLYPLERKIIFHNKTTNKDIEYLLPLDLLYLNSTIYDEFVLDYENQECYIMKKVKYDKILENVAIGNDLSSALLSLNLTNMQSNITYIQTDTYRIIEKYSTAEDAITLEKYNGNTWDKIDTLYRYTTSEQVNLKEYTLPFDFGVVTSIYSTQLDNVNNYTQVQKLGNKIALTEPQKISYTYPTINLTEGDYEISVRGQDSAYMFIRLMAKNLYTSQFATKVELKSSITQTKNEITLDVNGKIDTIDEDLNAKIDLKVDTDKLVSEINASAGVIRLNSNRFSMTSDNSSINEDGEAIFKKANIGGFVTNTTSFTKNLDGIYKYTAFDVNFLRYVLLGYNNLAKDNLTKNVLDANNDGSLTSADLLEIRQIVLGQTANTKKVTGKVSINSNDPKNCFKITDNNDNVAVAIGLGGINSKAITAQNIVLSDTTSTAASDSNFVALNGIDGSVRATTITQTSLAENKKNFEKYSGALEEIANIDIYKYNLKNEKNTDKKHLGFVIGDKFNYSQEITTKNNDQVDLYSMISLCMQGLKEQQKIINKLEQKIVDLENK